ncbi:peptidoglycan-binding domain-containing protein [Pseudooceanicola nanhaiensis]|uniref:peptidoglycan-binding domain-containing protein n=1 Tax=Pseudooceanicola nanhaiensis TaxID=375761 RepID=UPI001CD3CD75|nr:peptidoglycan-binding domain-containing protein [Pseudooceanicola nanhaiensis]MCA0919317.1 peptidoglycan-binding protein [Pseudooceanicola nanhaiensis]
MITKSVKVALAASIMATAPIQGMASDLGAALVGGIIGGAIMSGAAQNKQKQRTYSAPRTSSANTVARQANRETQTSLNYFGFNAGTPDGVMGSRSRTAISQYQAYMSFPVTGQLTPFERDHLVTSYNRAQIGGPEVMTAVQRHPDGARSLLVAWRDQKFGTPGRSTGVGYAGLPIEVSEAIDEIADSTEPSAEQLLQRTGFIQMADLNGDGRNDYVIDTAVTGSNYWCGQSQCSTLVFTSKHDGYQRHDFQYRRNASLTNTVTTAMFACDRMGCEINDPLNGGTMAAAAPAAPMPQVQPSMPSGSVMASQPAPSAPAPQPLPVAGGATLAPLPFAAPAAAPQPSLASYCSKVSLLTNSNGGYTTLATMADPELALSEQFCLSRTYSIAKGEEMVSQVQGLSTDQIDAQCDAFGAGLASYVSMLYSTDAGQVTAQVQKFVLDSNMTLEQARQTGAICLYTGYRRDKMDVALGSALLLIGAGQTPYAELIGHHLSQGFGTAESPALAQGWYKAAVTALTNGAEAVFAPGQTDRAQLIDAAATGLTAPMSAPAAATPQATALPTFTLK